MLLVLKILIHEVDVTKDNLRSNSNYYHCYSYHVLVIYVSIQSAYDQCKLNTQKLKEMDIGQMRSRANILLSNKERLAYLEILRSGSGRNGFPLVGDRDISCFVPILVEQGAQRILLQWLFK